MAPFFANLLNSPSFSNFSSFGTASNPGNEPGPSTSPPTHRPRPEQRRQLSTTSTNLSVAGLSIDDATLQTEGPTSRGGAKSRPTSWAPSTATVEAGRDKERRRRKKKVAVEVSRPIHLQADERHSSLSNLLPPLQRIH